MDGVVGFIWDTGERELRHFADDALDHKPIRDTMMPYIDKLCQYMASLYHGYDEHFSPRSDETVG